MSSFNIVILGNANCGKSSLISLFDNVESGDEPVRSSSTLNLETSKGNVELKFLVPSSLIEDREVHAAVVLHNNKLSTDLNEDTLPQGRVHNVYSKADKHNYPSSLPWPKVSGATGEGVRELVTRLVSDLLGEDVTVSSTFKWEKKGWKEAKALFLLNTIQALEKTAKGMKSEFSGLVKSLGQ